MGELMKYILDRSGEDIKSVGGLCLIGQILKQFGFANHFSSPKTSDILKTEIALLCQARTDFNDVELFRDDDFFAEALDLGRVPSEPTLRQHLNACDDSIRSAIKNANLTSLKNVTFGREKVGDEYFIPVDIDVSPFDNSGSKKEGVSFTYKKVDGYAPIFAYVGTEGYLLNCDLRPGAQHSQKDAPDFLKQCVTFLRELGVLQDCLFRLDSAHDATENLDILTEAGCNYIIKRNLRRESRYQWADRARATGEIEEPRPGKYVRRGVLSHLQPPHKTEEKNVADLPVFAVFEVTERTIDDQGVPLLIPDYQVDTWWTNLPHGAKDIIASYHAHGTSEQFHSEFKTDMNVERLPSGKFSTNATILLLSGIAFNILRLIGQTMLAHSEAMPARLKIQRRRLGSVIRDLVYIACKRVKHAGSVRLRFGKRCPWFKSFAEIYHYFLQEPKLEM